MAFVRVLAALGLVVALASPAAGADTGWTIESFHADIAIRADGSLAITETIAVDFDGLAKHGIFRVIPTRYTYDSGHDRLYDLRFTSVTDAGGARVPYEVSTVPAGTEAKIGDANRTVSGKQTYRVAYTVVGALNRFDDHDELYWNVNGADWEVPTLAASATVTAPGGAIIRTSCFQGRGSSEGCRPAGAGDRTDFTATRPLAPGEQLTIVAGLRPGAVSVAPPTLVGRQRTFLDFFTPTPVTVGLAAAALVAGLWAVFQLWWLRGRDQGRARGAIVPEYEPPDKLRPAQLGVLIDETADPKDLTASIVDLAVRGYLRITEQAGHGVFGHTEWILDKLKPGDDLLPYERSLYDGVFRDGDSVKLSDLRGHFQLVLQNAERQLYGDATSRGWFASDPSKVRIRYGVVAVVALMAALGLASVLGALLGAGLVGLALVPAALALGFVARAMPARTAAGAEVLARTLGFKRYMETAEKDRAAFAEKEGLFTEYLPYAVMFGCVSGWARAFAGLDATQAVSGWYVGPGPFNALVFSSSLQTFSSTLTSTVVTTPAGSGGSGFSGGFSGGGGGGGGGGSW
jgi:predicted membrane protein DUF2207